MDLESLKHMDRVRVLMVEDDLEFAQDITAILASDIDVRHAKGTREASEMLSTDLPELVWLDMELPPFFGDAPKLEGLAFLRHIRSALGVAVPVIVVSGQMGPEMQDELLAAGAQGCFTKPPDLPLIRKVIQELKGR